MIATVKQDFTACFDAALELLFWHYAYGPFGEVIRATGPMAKNNPFRFSTKYQDEESDLLYFGYRYYNASMGRWLNRDPIGERGGLNLYDFVHNEPLDESDALGLLIKTIKNTMWSTPLNKGKSVTSCSCNGNIGTVYLRYAWIDADRGDSIQTYDPSLYNWITTKVTWRTRQLKWFNDNTYLGAGIAMEFVPNRSGTLCCSKISWDQQIAGHLYGWNEDKAARTAGNIFVDSPGGLSSSLIGTTSWILRLRLKCDSDVVAEYYWSVVINAVGPEVTLTTPF